jgi:hypothetical protein
MKLSNRAIIKIEEEYKSGMIVEQINGALLRYPAQKYRNKHSSLLDNNIIDEQKSFTTLKPV